MRVRKKLMLSEAERSELRKLVKNGRHSASEISHARILLDLDENSESRYTQKEIAVRLEIVDSASDNGIRLLLKNTT